MFPVVSTGMLEIRTKLGPRKARPDRGCAASVEPETQIDSFGSPSRTSSLSLGLSPFAHNFALDRTR